MTLSLLIRILINLIIIIINSYYNTKLAKVFYIKIIYYYDIFNEIISDRELIFINNF